MPNTIKCNSCKYWDKGLDDYPCNKCIHNSIDKYVPITNLERIKSMSAEELADFICDIYSCNEHREIRVGGEWMLPENVEEWLNTSIDIDDKWG